MPPGYKLYLVKLLQNQRLSSSLSSPKFLWSPINSSKIYVSIVAAVSVESERLLPDLCLLRCRRSLWSLTGSSLIFIYFVAAIPVESRRLLLHRPIYRRRAVSSTEASLVHNQKEIPSITARVKNMLVILL